MIAIVLGAMILATAVVLLAVGQSLLTAFIIAAVTPAILICVLWGEEIMAEFKAMNDSTSTSEPEERPDDHSQHR